MSKRKKLLPWFTLIVFTLSILLCVNFNKVSYLMNEDAYESVNCRVDKQNYDGLLAFFPRIEVAYTYKGTKINSEKVVYSGIFFNDKVSDRLNIYVNKSSPKDFLIEQPYFDSWVNWILTVNMGIFIGIFSYNVVENIRRNVKIKKERRQ